MARAPGLLDTSRHPSARARRQDLAGIARRFEAALAEARAAHPAVGAAAIVARGAAGGSAEVLAARHGVEVGVVRSVEAGEVSLAEVPAPLRHLTVLGAVHAQLATRLPSGEPQTEGMHDEPAGPSRGRQEQGSSRDRRDHRGPRSGTG